MKTIINQLVDVFGEQIGLKVYDFAEYVVENMKQTETLFDTDIYNCSCKFGNWNVYVFRNESGEFVVRIDLIDKFVDIFIDKGFIYIY